MAKRSTLNEYDTDLSVVLKVSHKLHEYWITDLIAFLDLAAARASGELHGTVRCSRETSDPETSTIRSAWQWKY